MSISAALVFLVLGPFGTERERMVFSQAVLTDLVFVCYRPSVPYRSPLYQSTIHRGMLVVLFLFSVSAPPGIYPGSLVASFRGV